MTRSRIIISLLFAAALLAQAPASRRPIKLDDMHAIHDVRDPQLSPDGKWVAYTLSSVDVAADKTDTDIWTASWDGTQQLRMTSSTEAETSPRWSPDGKYLSFLSSRPGKARGNQVWLLDRNGGEAQQLTDFKGRLASYEWAPDSKRLLLTMSDRDPDEPDPDRPAGATAKAPKPIVIDRYKFKQDVIGYLYQKPARLYVYDIESKKADPLTSETLEVASPSWSPDGRQVAFLGKEGKDAERYSTFNLYVVDASAGATPKLLTTYEGTKSSASRAKPEWSPDGQRLVYLQASGAKQNAYNVNRVAVISMAGAGASATPVLPVRNLDRTASSPRFSRDGKSIVFLVSDDRWEYPVVAPASGGFIDRLTRGSGVVSSIEEARSGGYVVLASSDADPAELGVFENGALRPITHHNGALMAQLALGATEEFSAKAKDGNEVHGLLVKPPGFEAGRKYPLLLRIHGGPNGQDAHSFSFERQFFAANGYLVAAVNYRGSSGRGEAYQVAISADWGNKEVIDLQAATDYLLSTGIVDPERLGVGGWSYGGILTDALIAKDQRFKAVTSGAGTAFPLGLYGVDQYVMQYDMEIGAPWKVGLEPWNKISYAFLHADKIKTPTLFLGGEKDFNVPLVGGEQMYQALASLGVPTQLIVYPNSFHGITRPSYQKDRMERYLAWYAKYLKPATN